MRRILLIALILLFPAGAQAGFVSSEEQSALTTLYDATNGDNWTNNNSWLDFKSGVCTWFGVTCSSEQDAVIAINLSGNNLQGALPASLGNLSNLQDLRLESNPGLTGPIPAEAGNLAQLRILLLNDNSLSGPIPNSLGGLTQMLDLRLFSNRLSGAIPAELGSLASLQVLFLDDNQLTGTIPATLGNLVNLEFLDLTSNQLEGPIPPQLATLSQLVNPSSGALGLGLNFNKLFLAEPADASLTAFLNAKAPNWDDTQTIAPGNVSASRIGGDIEVSWTPIEYTGNDGAYEVLSSTTSGGPYTLVGSTANKSAAALSVPASGSGASFVVVRTRTDPHSFNQNTLTSGFSAEAMTETAIEFTDREVLEALYFATNGDDWTDNDGWLGEAGSECSWFGVTCNKAEDAVIALDLSDNNLQGTLTFRLGELSQLLELRLDGNRGLSGPIPAAIGDLSKLEVLDLSGNSLGGLVPKTRKAS